MEPGLTLVAQSRWFRSAPVPASDQPDYVNGVVRMEGAMRPHAILERLHAIEAEGGRLRGAPNAARTLDLDLLAVGEQVIADAVLTLPHPRLAIRGFVLAPLCDVTPEWWHPTLHRTAADLLRTVGQEGVAPL